MVTIARWSLENSDHAGFVHDGRCVELPRSWGVQDLLDAGLEATLELAEQLLAVDISNAPALEEVTLLAPLQPQSIRDFVAFEEHVEGITASVDGASEVVPEWYQAPTFYFTNPHTVHATGDVIPVPSGCQRMDFETEVAVVVGAAPGLDGRDLEAADAHRMIFGYTIFNDWSARDVQAREMKVRLGPCKGKDFASTVGPWIVTADEFTELHDDEGFLHLAMTPSINGVQLGTDSLANMGWPLAELVAYASQDSVVVPGDILGSGTCGRGCLAELWGRAGELTPPPLAEGDVVALEIQGIGRIENTVGARRSDVFPPASPARARRRSALPSSGSGAPAANRP